MTPNRRLMTLPLRTNGRTALAVVAVALCFASGLVLALLDSAVAQAMPIDATLYHEGRIALAALGSLAAAAGIGALCLAHFTRPARRQAPSDRLARPRFPAP